MEYIDVYTEDRVSTGVRLPREGLFLREGQYMLYVLAIIQDLDGRILITQRALDKHWAAGAWEVSGGGVLSGEKTAAAVVREVGEEVGLDVSGLVTDPVYSYRNVDLARGDNYIVDIYRFELDVDEDDVTLQDSEAIDVRFATWDEITQLAADGQFLHYERIGQALALL